MAETDINSVERSRSAAVTEVKKALPPGKYCSILHLIILKSPWSKKLEEVRTKSCFKLSVIAAQSLAWCGATFADVLDVLKYLVPLQRCK